MMSSRQIRRGVVSAATITKFYVQSQRLHHAFEDEFAHLAWGANMRLGAITTLVVLV